MACEKCEKLEMELKLARLELEIRRNEDGVLLTPNMIIKRLGMQHLFEEKED